MTKKEIRSRIRSLRKALTEEERKEKSAGIAARLFRTEEYRSAGALMAYASYGSEVQTKDIIRQALADGKKVSLPRVEGDIMLFIENNGLSGCAAGYAGIPEPQKGDVFEPEKFEGKTLMLMPGVGFDPERNRIGQGGGFYDRYLAAHPDMTTLALSFDCQIVEHIPTEETDLKPDLIVTESRIIR